MNSRQMNIQSIKAHLYCTIQKTRWWWW